MIYSYITPNSITESTKKSEEIVSVVYNEYCNYKNLLESCTDEHERPILEAKVEVLYEISFKDIIQKIKDKIHEIIEWVKGLIKKIKEKLASIFDRKKNVMNAWKSKKVSTGESAFLFEADENYSSDGKLMKCLSHYEWKCGTDRYDSSHISTMFDNATSKLEAEINKVLGHCDKLKEKEDILAYIEVLKKNKEDVQNRFNTIAESAEYVKSTDDKDYDSDDVDKDVVIKYGDWYYHEIQELDKYIKEYELIVSQMGNVNTLQKMVNTEIENTDTPDNVKTILLTRVVPIIISMMQNMRASCSQFITKMILAQNSCVSRLSYITKYAKRKKWIGF